MPLGLLADGWRTADALARQALGGRGASVFAIPPRPVWAAPDYATGPPGRRGHRIAAVAWSARRIAAGTACVLPGAPHTQLSDDGFEITVSY